MRQSTPLQGGRGVRGALAEHLLEVVAALRAGVPRQRRHRRQPLQQVMRARLLQQIHADARQLPVLQPHLRAACHLSTTRAQDATSAPHGTPYGSSSWVTGAAQSGRWSMHSHKMCCEKFVPSKSKFFTAHALALRVSRQSLCSSCYPPLASIRRS